MCSFYLSFGSAAKFESMTAFHEQPRRAESFGQLRFYARCLAAFDVLKMKSGSGQHFDASLQYASRRPDAGLVLIESLRRAVLAHPHVHAVGLVPIAEIEQNQV